MVWVDDRLLIAQSSRTPTVDTLGIVSTGGESFPDLPRLNGTTETTVCSAKSVTKSI